MLKRMVYNIGGVSLVLTLIMLLASVSSILLGRVLSKDEFGEFSLMRTLVLFIPPLAVWGQDVATARFFAKNDASHYQWSRAFRTIMEIGSLLVLCCVIIAGFVYKISWPKMLALLVASLAYLSTLFFSNLVRGQGRYRQSILMLNGFRGAFFLFVLVLYFTKNTTATLTIMSYYGIMVLFAIQSARYTFAHVKQGDLPIPKEMHTTGLLLMGSQVSVTLIGSLDSLFIPGLLDLASLALYQAAVVPSQIFNIVGRAGKYVWVPEFGRTKNIQMKKITILVSIVAIVLATGMIFFAEPILHLLFDGKYDDGANILRILVAAGAIRLFYNFASSVIIGKMEKDALIYHLAVTIVMVFVEIGSLIFFLKNYGVLGAALAMLLVTILRTAGSYAVIYRFKDQLTSNV